MGLKTNPTNPGFPTNPHGNPMRPFFAGVSVLLCVASPERPLSPSARLPEGEARAGARLQERLVQGLGACRRREDAERWEPAPTFTRRLAGERINRNPDINF